MNAEAHPRVDRQWFAGYIVGAQKDRRHRSEGGSTMTAITET
jgi:hypothetical protein